MDNPGSAAKTQPVPTSRLEEIATKACDSTFQHVETYEHQRVSDWNTEIINTTLAALMAETSTTSQSPPFKFAVTSTIIQHVTPPPSAPTSKDPAHLNGADQYTSSIGRRGMHSASGAYWNNEKDGMWNWKYPKSEEKGFDVVLSIIWISIV